MSEEGRGGEREGKGEEGEGREGRGERGEGRKVRSRGGEKGGEERGEERRGEQRVQIIQRGKRVEDERRQGEGRGKTEEGGVDFLHVLKAKY